MKKTFYETENFAIGLLDPVHIDRNDGGHICIFVKGEQVGDRTELSPQKTVELARLTMMAGAAYETAMKNQGVPIVRINYQDNGN